MSKRGLLNVQRLFPGTSTSMSRSSAITGVINLIAPDCCGLRVVCSKMEGMKPRSMRPEFHITAPQGRLNDPNGLLLYEGKLHVFYQHDPGFPRQPKQTGWAHVSAPLEGEEALCWRHHPNALYPGMPYDQHGCYSGGAVVDECGQPWLFYTGNVKREGERFATQNAVAVDELDSLNGGSFRKYEGNPVIANPAPGYTAHYRDPMITRVDDGHAKWRMCLGAQREDDTGAVVLYRSADLMHWEFQGELQFHTDRAEYGSSPDLIPEGYMWECPNLLRMRDGEDGLEYDVLVICPQGMDEVVDGGVRHYASSDQCGYLVGRLDGVNFHVTHGFSELDYGHTFYAPQLIAAVPGQMVAEEALMLGWMGLPGRDDLCTLDQGWVHALTLPRRLHLEGGVLYQQPVLPSPVREEESGVTWYSQRCVRKVFGAFEDFKLSMGGVVCISRKGGVLSLEYQGDVRAVTGVDSQVEVIVDGVAVEVFAGDGSIAFALLADELSEMKHIPGI